MTYKLIDYERLKAFSEGLKSKYAKRTDISNMKISQFVDVYKLDKSIFDAAKNDKNFIDAINRDIFTLVVYDEHNTQNFRYDDGCNSYVFYKGATIGVSPRFAQVPSLSNVIESAIFDSHCFINQTFMNAYNKVIQKEIEAVQPSEVSFKDLDSLKEAGLFFCANSNLKSNGLLLNKVSSTGFVRQFLFLTENQGDKNNFVVKARRFNGNTEKWGSWQIFWASEMLDEKINTKIDKTAITDDYYGESHDKIVSQKGVTAFCKDFGQKINEELHRMASKEEIPKKLSQLENDKTFKTEAEIQSMIEKASSLKKEVVTSLPQTGKDDVIYLVKDNKGKDNNNYLEYLWLNGKYELIGSTQVDLSGYAKIEDIVASKVVSIYELDKDFWDALANDQNFQQAIRRDVLTLVSFKGENQLDLMLKAGFETVLYYKGEAVSTVPIVSQSYDGFDKDIRNNAIEKSAMRVTCDVLSAYNSTIQAQLKEQKDSSLNKASDKAIAPQNGNLSNPEWKADNKYVTPQFMSSYMELKSSDLGNSFQSALSDKLSTSDIQEFTQQELEEAFR